MKTVHVNSLYFPDKTMYYIGKTGAEHRIVLYTSEEKNKAFDECHVVEKSGDHCGKFMYICTIVNSHSIV